MQSFKKRVIKLPWFVRFQKQANICKAQLG
jgi:hypothetical protein